MCRWFNSGSGHHCVGIAHLVERHLAKVEVASSSLVARSIFSLTRRGFAAFAVSGGVVAIAISPHTMEYGDIAKW